MTARRILVIKLGALGDFVQATGPFAAIRAHHADAHITLLTRPAYAAFARDCPWFDAVWTDEGPRLTRPLRVLSLRRRLREGRFERVYDLQTSSRSAAYFRLLGPGRRPEWSGVARGCSHPHDNPKRDLMHTLDRQAEQLRMAGIDHVPGPDLTWVRADIARFSLQGAYALLVPGGAAHRPAKRWPADRFAVIARAMLEMDVTPVILGTGAEREAIAAIRELVPKAVNLAGLTDFADIVALARTARCAVGNDTGPMHLIAAAGCPSVVLFSRRSDPALCAPRGERVTILRRDDLSTLPPLDVGDALTPYGMVLQSHTLRRPAHTLRRPAESRTAKGLDAPHEGRQDRRYRQC